MAKPTPLQRNPVMETRAARLCKGWGKLFLLLLMLISGRRGIGWSGFWWNTWLVPLQFFTVLHRSWQRLWCRRCAPNPPFFTEKLLFRERWSFSPAIFHPNPSATHLATASFPAHRSKTHYIPASLPLQSAFAGRCASISIPFLEVHVALQDAFLCFKLLWVECTHFYFIFFFFNRRVLFSQQGVEMGWGPACSTNP